MPDVSPLAPLLARNGRVVLDGGLATELERRGHDLAHPLWSAEVLRTTPDAVRDVHRDYLAAGADVITAASYQASLPGLFAQGLSSAAAERLLRLAVGVALEARAAAVGRESALVAASVGPYGAYLADGSEYTGAYGVSPQVLREFHAPRWEILADAGADLLACETIPGIAEAEVLRAILDASPFPAWVSFACRDDGHAADGTPVERCVALFAGCAPVVALGVNCTAPRHIPGLIERIRAADPSVPVAVYPNSGEVYDATLRRWTGTADPVAFATQARDWADRGARLIGGCCRTTPAHIRSIRAALSAT